jgi:hypothetical protein
MQGKCDSINKNNVYNCLSHRFHNEQAQICAEGCEGGLLLHRLVWPFFVVRFYIWTGLDNTYLGFTGHVMALLGLYGFVWACLLVWAYLVLFGRYGACLIYSDFVFTCLGMCGAVLDCLVLSWLI